jgi:hypothetical protein
MPPQVYYLWPEDVKSVLSTMDKHVQEGDRVALARACKRVEAILTRLEVGTPNRLLRCQIARTYYEL